MKRNHVLTGLFFATGLFLFISACVVAPPYDNRGGYYGDTPNVVIHEPPLFVYPPSLGFYAAIGVPYDIFYFDSFYYMHNRNNWYRSSKYNGPWHSTRYDKLPKAMKKHRYEDMVHGRDSEYREYQKEPRKYNGKRFRPGKNEYQENNKDSRDKHKQR